MMWVPICRSALRLLEAMLKQFFSCSLEVQRGFVLPMLRDRYKQRINQGQWSDPRSQRCLKILDFAGGGIENQIRKRADGRLHTVGDGKSRGFILARNLHALDRLVRATRTGNA